MNESSNINNIQDIEFTLEDKNGDDEVVVSSNDIQLVDNIEFLTLFRSMIDKLPPPLKDPIEGINPIINQIKEKEFCYKFLYSMKNNSANKNPVTNKIYNNIIDYYGIGELRSPQTPPFNLENGIIRELQVPLTKEQVLNDSLVSAKTTIQFEDGFVVSIATPQKGGATQKRRKYNRKKYTNYTIKGR